MRTGGEETWSAPVLSEPEPAWALPLTDGLWLNGVCVVVALLMLWLGRDILTGLIRRGTTVAVYGTFVTRQATRLPPIAHGSCQASVGYPGRNLQPTYFGRGSAYGAI